MTQRAEVVGQLAEIFREHGFEGASLSLITERTGLGKGSLYHFFPRGKDQMAEDVLSEIEGWFEREIFAPLEQAEDARDGLKSMLAAVETYFHSGRRICLIGAFALDATRDRFSARIDTYFEAWTAAITIALERLGRKSGIAQGDAEAMLSLIQGALVLARARGDAGIFSRMIGRIAEGLG